MYVTTLASFMSTLKCLVSLVQQMKGQFSCTAKNIRRDFYVDNLMTKNKTQEECVQLHKEII